MASERSVVVRIRAEIAQFRSDMRQAAQSSTEFGTSVGAAGVRSSAAMGKMRESAVTARASMGRLAADARDNADAWDRAGTSMMAFGAGALAVVGVAISKFASFDKAMSSVEAATHESAENMELLREAAISAGADTAFSAEEAAQAIEELAKAGVSTADILGGGLDGALSLAAAGALGVGEAAEIAATALTQFQLSGDQIPHLADLLAAGAGKAQGSVEDLGNALNQSGLVAAQTGLSIEETTGGLAAFASAGMVGSDAGTSFKSMLQRLTPQSKEAEKKMAELGISAYDAQGEFIGLTKFAGNLQESMKALTPEARNAAMGVIFGSDAVRAASIVYEEGADGVQEWIDNVNDAGYAATTAAIMQDNLAGDIEKLGGSFDTVFIKGGGSASEALRKLVQQAEGLVDTVGKIPTPILETGVALIGTVGGIALAGGAFLKFTPKVLDTIDAFRGLGTEGSRVPGMMGRVAKGAGLAVVAIAALSIAARASSRDVEVSTTEMATAVLKLTKSGEGVDSLDSMFQGWDTFLGSSTVGGINSASDAVARLSDVIHNGDGGQSWLSDNVISNLGGPDGYMSQIKERFDQVGESLGNLASGGSLDSAATGFKKLNKEFEANGLSARDALDAMPSYEASLLELGQSVGVALEPTELLDLAMGKVPDRMAAAGFAVEGTSTIIGSFTDATGQAIPITEEMGKMLEEMGVSATGAVTALDKYIDTLFAAGLSTLSTRDAQRGYRDALDGVTASITENGYSMDMNTEQGRANQAALDGVASSGISVMQAMAATKDAYGENVYTQEELQGTLRTTYDDLIAQAGQFGITGGEADGLARSVLGIPADANIDTWMSDYAKRVAEQTTGALDAVDGRHVTASITMNEYTNRQVTETLTKLRGGDTSAPAPVAPGPWAPGGAPRLAVGGAIHGPGTGTSDTAGLFALSNGEHVLTAMEVQAMGGQKAVYDFRSQLNAGIPAYATGGRVGREYSAPASSVSGHMGGEGTTVQVTNNIYGATDVNAVRQAVTGDLTFILQKNGVRLGK